MRSWERKFYWIGVVAEAKPNMDGLQELKCWRRYWGPVGPPPVLFSINNFSIFKKP
jgi:hypothetical protein